jgi:hypothetical protein
MNCRSMARRPVGSCSSKDSMSVISIATIGLAAFPAFSSCVRGLQDEVGMVRVRHGDPCQFLEGRPQMGPMFYEQGPVAAIFQHAVQKTVWQGIMGRKYTQAVCDIDRIRSFRQ